MAGRHVTILYGVLLAAASAAAGAWYAGSRIESPADAAARTAPPPPSPILVPVEEKVLSAEIITRGTARFGLPQPVSLAPSPLKAGPGLITALPARNAPLNEGDVMLSASGRPVFVEKPLALNVADALRIRAACDAAGVVLAVGHNRRFFPAMRELKRLAADGTLGTLLHVEGNFSGSFGLEYDSSAWRASEKEAPGGGLTLMGVHIFDAMIDLLGPIASVGATSLRQVLKIELDDTSAGVIRFAGGQSGYMSTLTATARLWRMQLFGTRGWAHVLDHEILEIGLTGQPVRRITWPVEDAERFVMEAFARAVADGVRYPVPLDEVINGIAALDAFVRSSREGGAIVPVAWPSPQARGAH